MQKKSDVISFSAFLIQDVFFNQLITQNEHFLIYLLDHSWYFWPTHGIQHWQEHHDWYFQTEQTQMVTHNSVGWWMGSSWKECPVLDNN